MITAPLQSFGLGDVIFCQTIVNKWISEGDSIVWGVFPQFIDQLNRAYPHIAFVDWQTLPIDYERKDEHDSNGYRVVPLRWADTILKVPYTECMKAKYMLFDMDWRIWQDHAMWQRDL